MSRIRPIRWDWLFFTFVIPILPLAIAWDGMVSNLRSYSAVELQELVDSVSGHAAYRWEIGVAGGPWMFPTITRGRGCNREAMLMSAGESRAYDSGTKETWRNTVWNILAKEADRTRPCIYLAGPEDNDRLVAIRHGYPHHLLVAVDKSKDNINDAVKEKHCGLGLDAPLESVCWVWPSTWPIGAVVADFCGGGGSLMCRTFLR